MNADETKIVLEVQAQLKAASANITKLLAVVPPVEPPVIVPGSTIKGLGYTWVQSEGNKPKLSRAELNAFAPIQVAFCSSFGGGDFLPDANGPIIWSAIEQSINRIRTAPVPVAILGMWPGAWTGAGNTFDPGANERRPLEANFPKVAAFAGQFAARYPEIVYYAFTGEWKGSWHSGKNTWDVDLNVGFGQLLRTEILKNNPKAKFIGDYMVLKFAASLDNNASQTWRGPGWVGDERTLQTVIEYTRRFKPDIIGVDFAPVVAGAGFEPFFKFVDLLRAAGLQQPVFSLETYMGGDPTVFAQAVKRAALDPCGIAFSVWGEVGLGGALNNPFLDAGLAQKIKAVTG